MKQERPIHGSIGKCHGNVRIIKCGEEIILRRCKKLRGEKRCVGEGGTRNTVDSDCLVVSRQRCLNLGKISFWKLLFPKRWCG